MASTANGTFTENLNSNTKSVWTVSVTGQDITVSDSAFQLPALPSANVKAKYVGSNKGYADIYLYLTIQPQGVSGRDSNYAKGDFFNSDKGISWASGSTNTLTQKQTSTQTFITSNVFNSNNPTSKTVSIVALGRGYFRSHNSSYDGMNTATGNYNQLYQSSNKTIGTIGRITLNAPPTYTSTVSSSENYYVGASTYSVALSSVTAKYGGSITQTKLTVGSQSVTGSGNGTLSINLNTAGVFIPTVVVTDSRGQTTTKMLPSITVNPYVIEISSLTSQRIDENAALSDEGENAVIKAVINRSVFTGNYLLKPTVKVNGTTTNNVTWYTSWDSTNGFSGEVNWTNYAPSSPVTLYGKCTNTFDIDTSYRISVTPSATYGNGNAIISVLAQAFYLLAGRAGGHGLGIGMKCRADGELDIALNPYIFNTLTSGGYAGLNLYTENGGALSYIRAYADSNASSYGNNMVIDSGGNLIVGAGESANTIYAGNINSASESGENLYLSADGAVYIYSNCDTIEKRNRLAFSTAGNLFVLKNDAWNEYNSVTENSYSSKLSWTDSNGNSLGYMEGYKTPNDVIYNRIVARRHISNSYVSANLGIGVDASGNAVALVSGTGLAASFRTALGVVNKTGDTMTGNLIIERSSSNVSRVYLDSSDVVSKMGASTPSNSQTLGAFTVRDKNDFSCGWMQVIKNTSDAIRLELYASRPNASGTRVSHGLALLIDSSGNRSVSVHDAAAWRNALNVRNIQTKTVTETTNSQSCINLRLDRTKTVVLAVCNTDDNTAYDISLATFKINTNWYAHVTTTTGNANISNGISVTLLVYYMTI